MRGPGRAGRRRAARRRPALALTLALLGAGLLVAVPALLGVGGSAGAPTAFQFEGALAYAHHGSAAKVKRSLVADRWRFLRCAQPAFRVRNAARCPSARAYRNTRLLRAVRGSQRAAEDPASTIGQWGAEFAFPTVSAAQAGHPSIAIHAAVLPTGKVLFFSYPFTNYTSAPNLSTYAYLWDPATGGFKEVDPPVNPATGLPYDIWCAGQTFLPDGRLVVAGGTLAYEQAGPPKVNHRGLKEIFTFNPWTESWALQSQRMRRGRWYPTLLALPDGRVVVVSGRDEVDGSNNPDVEVFTPSPDPNGTDGTIALKPTASRTIGLYPHLFVLPNGTSAGAGGTAQNPKVLLAGPGRTAANDSAILDTATWTWKDLSPLDRNRDYGAAVLLPGGTGGATRVALYGGNSTATPTSRVLDLNNTAAGWTAGSSFADGVGRSHLNTVVLPDGSLFAAGGGAGAVNGDNYSGPVYRSQLMPAGGTAWINGPNQADERTYHSVALLLPDGRVLSAGDDRPSHQGLDQRTAEIYSPPYLFKGARPVIADAPASVGYQGSFTVATPDAASVTRAVLMAPAAVTHAIDMNQRSVELTVTRQSGSVALGAPTNQTVAPPGQYMLFLLNGQGVPSVARFVRLDPGTAAPPPANQPPAAAFTVAPLSPAPGQAVTLTDTSSDPDGTIAARAWDLNGDGVYAEGAGATATTSFPAPGTYVVGLQATDDDGAASQTTRQVLVAAPPAGNLVANSSFESGTGGWQGLSATLSAPVLADAPDGTHAARVDWAAANATKTYELDDTPNTVTSAPAGATYTATASIKAATQGTVGKSIYLRIVERSPSGASVNLWSGLVSAGTSFTPVTVSSGPIAAGNRVEVRVGQGSSAAGQAFYVDRITLAQTNAGPPPNQAPSASFGQAPASPQAGQTVTFTDTSTDPDGSIASRAWDLDGDGQFDDDAGATAARVFPSAGTYTVRLQVTDNMGAPAVASRQVVVSGAAPANQPPAAAFTVAPLSPAPGQAVTLTDTSSDPDGTIAARAWDLNGDGVYAEGAGATATTSFPAPGTYVVGLQATDDDGAASQTTRQVLVAAPPAGNLVANSSFESGTGGWQGLSATLSAPVLADAPDGTHAARVDWAAANATKTYELDDTPNTVTSAPAGATYTATASIKAATQGTVGKSIYLRIVERSPSGASVNLWSGLVSAGTSFTPVTVSSGPIAAGNRVEVRVGQGSSAAGQGFYVDRITLARAS